MLKQSNTGHMTIKTELITQHWQALTVVSDKTKSIHRTRQCSFQSNEGNVSDNVRFLGISNVHLTFTVFNLNINNFFN